MGLVFEVARRAPDLSFLAYSQKFEDLTDVPPNVELRDSPGRNERLYDEGDVCVLPSYWEGLGLQMLECQAAGMPLVTVDAPPMNEHRPLRTLPVARVEFVSLYGNYPLAAQIVDPDAMIQTLRGLVGMDLGAASREARAYVEQHHSWEEVGHLVRRPFIR